MISLAPYSSKMDPILFFLSFSNLDEMGNPNKITQSFQVTGCDVASISNELPSFLKINKPCIDPSIEQLELIVNPVILINYLLNKTGLINHLQSRFTSKTTYPFKSIVDFSILPNSVQLNCLFSIKITGILSKNGKTLKNTKYLQIHSCLDLDVNLFHPTNNNIHLDHPDISKYQSSHMYNRSLFLEQIKHYPEYKSQPTKRSAPVEPVIKMHNSLPINIPFYLKFYFNSIENDILQLYNENISRLYEQSTVIFSVLCHTLSESRLNVRDPNYLKLTQMDLSQFDDVIDDLKSILSVSKDTVNSKLLLNHFKNPLQSILISLYNNNENHQIQLKSILLFCNKYIPIQPIFTNIPLSTLSYLLFNAVIPNKSIPFHINNILPSSTSNTNSLYNSKSSECLMDYKLPTILYNINNNLQFTSSYSPISFLTLVGLPSSLLNELPVYNCFLWLMALPRNNSLMNTPLLKISVLIPHIPIKYHSHLKVISSLRNPSKVHLYSQLILKYSITPVVSKIQSKWRSYVKTKKHANLVLSQAMVRGILQRMNYASQINNIVNIQSAIRGILSVSKLIFIKHFAISLQSMFRGISSRADHKNITCSIIMTQSVIRGIAIRKQNNKLKFLIVNLQSVIRCKLETIKLNGTILFIVALQSVIRRRIATNLKNDVTKYIIKLQAAIRRKIQYNNHLVVKDNHAVMVKGILSLQSCIRRFLTRGSFLTIKSFAVSLQCITKGMIVRKNNEFIKSLIIMNQTLIRKTIVRSNYNTIMNSIILVQSIVRGFIELSCLKSVKLSIIKSSVCVQSCIRGMQCRLDCNYRLHYIICIQSFVRRKLQQSEYRSSISAIVAVQSVLRGFTQRSRHLQNLADIKLTATLISSALRSHLTRISFVYIRTATTNIQAVIRGHLIRQAGFETYKLQQLQLYSCTRIQSVFRGFRVRKDKVEKIRYVLDPINSIGHKCQRALTQVVKCKYIVDLLSACTEINKCVILSRDVCKFVLKHDAMGIFIRGLRITNRSEPHKLFILQVLKIIKTINKHLDLMVSCKNVNAHGLIKALIDLMVKYYRHEEMMGYIVQVLYLQSLNKNVFLEIISKYHREIAHLIELMNRRSEVVVMYVSKISKEKKYHLVGSDDNVMIRRGSRVGLSKHYMQAWFDDKMTHGQTCTILKSLIKSMENKNK
eukprot:NODE_571_length_6574_cov_0.317220.p1 type:complete len:1169 gc:universal NODE_571_length_6574_cov_0.317220:2835-6341(+)